MLPQLHAALAERRWASTSKGGLFRPGEACDDRLRVAVLNDYIGNSMSVDEIAARRNVSRCSVYRYLADFRADQAFECHLRGGAHHTRVTAADLTVLAALRRFVPDATLDYYADYMSQNAFHSRPGDVSPQLIYQVSYIYILCARTAAAPRESDVFFRFPCALMVPVSPRVGRCSARRASISRTS